jgi:hypothetical protein
MELQFIYINQQVVRQIGFALGFELGVRRARLNCS